MGSVRRIEKCFSFCGKVRIVPGMMNNFPCFFPRVSVAIAIGLALTARTAPGGGEDLPQNLRTENLVAWCVVPFDAKKRGPGERSLMLRELGLRRCAYDWRREHIAQFEEEILQYKKHGIEFFAFWAGHEDAFRLFKKHQIHPQIWRTVPSPKLESQKEKVEAAVETMLELAAITRESGCKLGLYNHGGWGGSPENMIAVCRRLHELGHEHVGIVYNWHHGHEEMDRWAKTMELLKPWLLCLNLNGMNRRANPKILALGAGEHEQAMLQIVVESGYSGPIGILDHQNSRDAKEVLQENLNGLSKILSKTRKAAASKSSSE